MKELHERDVLRKTVSICKINFSVLSSGQKYDDSLKVTPNFLCSNFLLIRRLCYPCYFLILFPLFFCLRKHWDECVWRSEVGTCWCYEEWHLQWRLHRTGPHPRCQGAVPGRRIATRGQFLLLYNESFPNQLEQQRHNHSATSSLFSFFFFTSGAQAATTNYTYMQNVSCAVCVCVCVSVLVCVWLR